MLADAKDVEISRAPRGARGLKSKNDDLTIIPISSRPARGAWIEMYLGGLDGLVTEVAPRAGRVD